MSVRTNYRPASECSPLLSDRAAAIATYIIDRGNRRARGLGRGTFDARYGSITELARRKYPLPAATIPTWATHSRKA